MSKFNLRDPRNEDEKALADNHGVLFLEDENGKCWYEAAKEFDNIFWKVATGSDGRVVSANKDATMLWPVNMEVHEVSAPPEFKIGDERKWKVEGKALVPYEESSEEVAARSAAIKSKIMARITPEIDTLKDAVEMGEITADEAERLEALKKYRLAVSRVDLQNPVWPEEV